VARVAAVSVLVLPALYAPAPSVAQGPPLGLAPVVITGNREPTPLKRIVGDIVVIDAERIRASSADSIEDLLRREGGIQLSRNGGPGQSASVLLRGVSASGMLVLVDGVRIGSASLGQVDFAGIALAQIERIEILRGPASSLYGADAVGGVIQIITRRGSGTPHLTAQAALGERRSSRLDAALGGASGALDYALSLGREASRGISAVKPGDTFGLFNPDRDGFRRTDLQARGGIALAPGHRVGATFVANRLRAQYDGAEFLPPSFAPDPSGDLRNRFDTRVATLDYRGELTTQWTTTATLSSQSDELVSGAQALSRFQTRRRQLTWQGAWTPVDDQQFMAALERLEERVDATVFGGSLRRHTDAVVVGYTGSFGALKLQADGRHDRNSVYGDVSTGKLGVALELRPGLTLRAVAGSAFRAPAFNDLYFPGYGVATVGPERARSVEATLQWQALDTSASVTVYRNRVRDLIAYESDRSFCPPDPGYDFGCARNLNRATLQGATLSARHRTGQIAWRATVDFLDAKDDATGERLERRAAHQESLGAEWTGGAWSAGADLLRVGARTEGGSRLPAYQIVDLQARYRFAANWRLEARLLNAFDRRYDVVRDYPALGRQAWLGVRYDGLGF
jgi:vitamin B12 transporter